MLSRFLPASPAFIPAVRGAVRETAKRGACRYRRGDDEASSFQADFDEIHVHLVEDDYELAPALEDLAVLAKPVVREVGTFSNLPVFAIGNGLDPAARFSFAPFRFSSARQATPMSRREFRASPTPSRSPARNPGSRPNARCPAGRIRVAAPWKVFPRIANASDRQDNKARVSDLSLPASNKTGRTASR